MVVVMGGAVRVDVNFATVIVDANVTFGQAMRDAGAGGESKGGRGRENAKRVESAARTIAPLTRIALAKTDSILRRNCSIGGKIHPLQG